MNKRKIAALVSIILASPLASHAEDGKKLEIEITEGQIADPAQQKTSIERLEKGISADGGDLLRKVPGVSGARMGGHGIDPVIRGQSQTQLNILLDGAAVHGACPNRMDPASAYSPIETYDSITVIKGAHTVIHGAGGSGGTVLFERKTDRMSDDSNLRGQVGAGYKGNSKTKDAFADITAGSSQGFVRAIAQYTDADNYKDGDGNETRTAFSQQAGNIILGYTPDFDTRAELSIEATREEDMLYAGAMMDAPESNNDTIRARFAKRNTGMFTEVKGEVYSAKVDHLMDNYSLRPVGMMYMKTPSISDTLGGRVSGEFNAGDNTTWIVGMDSQRNNREAIRSSGMMANMMTIQSYVWPDVDIDQTGLFAELKNEMSDTDTLKAGLRYDRINASAAKASETAAMGMTPNNLYMMYYGKQAKEQDDNNVGGFVRYEKKVMEGKAMVFTSASRTVRTADATERFMAANNMTAMMRWVGNPDIQSEKHQQVELGLSWAQNSWEANGAIFYNDVSDYILRDRAHGQSGINMSDNATIYRNVDATLSGFEASLTRHMSKQLSVNLSLAHVRAENDTDGRDIAQTPPLEGSLSADYQQAHWSAGAILHWADKQTRIDDNMMTGSGLDSGETSGFGVLNLYSARDLGKHTELKIGIDNVLDRTYSYHVNRANADPFNPLPVQVNEPGRSVWARAITRF